MNHLRLALVGALAVMLAACGNAPVKKRQTVYRRPPVVAPKPVTPPVATKPATPFKPVPKPTKPLVYADASDDSDGYPDPRDVPPGLENLPDLEPQFEPKSAGGNSSSYEVFGKTYRVRDSAEGYKERGGASWYGRKFHGRKTSNGEVYDMFALSAAHRSLPIPTYARVTNLDNGKSCIVRINDRGPFHSERIIDLSYAAAVKLGMLHHGEVPVEIEAITPRQFEASAKPEPKPEPAARFLEVAAFEDPINAVALREELTSNGLHPVEIRSANERNVTWHRVLMGPFADRVALETSRRLLETARYGAKPVLQ